MAGFGNNFIVFLKHDLAGLRKIEVLPRVVLFYNYTKIKGGYTYV